MGTRAATASRSQAPPTDYAELKRRIREAGLLGLQPWRSGLGIATNALLLAALLLCVVRFHQPWQLALDAVGLGLMSTQLGFQVHDASHHQLFERAWKNRLVGFLSANVLVGISFAWWVDEHIRHHANPNHMDLDPDIVNMAIAYSTGQALGRPTLLRLIAKYQAFLFFPLICFTAWIMHAQAVGYVVRRRFRGRWLEAAALAVHGVLYVGLLLFLLGPWSALLVIAIQKATTGIYVALVIAPNHQGMLQVDDNVELDLLRKQVLTSRNIRSNWLTDLCYGSLNLQIEHHLFPRMTRNNLPRARAIVRQFCEERGVPYHETSVPQAVRELIQFLHQVGVPLRDPLPADGRARGAGRVPA